jgi:hypothetical protein
MYIVPKIIYEPLETSFALSRVRESDLVSRELGMKELNIVPVTLDEANAFVRTHHRHHAPVPGAKFCVAVARDSMCEPEIVGVAIVGRPVARMLDDGWTLEVNRTCTDGTKNANSALYGACRRAAWALGYRRLITYTLPTEGGASLRAADWKCIGETGGGRWSRQSRPRVDTHPLQVKMLWEAQKCEAERGS